MAPEIKKDFRNVYSFMIFDPVGYEIMKIKLYIILFFQGVYGEGAKGLNHVELVHRVL